MNGYLGNAIDWTFSDRKQNILQFIDDEFYDLLFGLRAISRILTETDRTLLNNVEQLIGSPERLANQIPELPKAFSDWMDTYHGPVDEFIHSTTALCDIPYVANVVIDTANRQSSNLNNGRIQTIQKAMASIGYIESAFLATTAVMFHTISAQPGHSKTFGHIIRQHTLQMSTAARVLTQQNKIAPFDSHLLTLTHNIGYVTIFNYLYLQLHNNNPIAPFDSFIFQTAMQRSARAATEQLSKTWQLPAVIIAASKQQTTRKLSDLCQILLQAKLFSQVSLLCKHQKLDFKEALDLLQCFGLSKEDILLFFDNFCTLNRVA
jgi:hypothetical protein